MSSNQRALCSGRGPVRRAGADPPRQSGAARAPEVAYPASCLPGTGCDGKLQTKRGRQRCALRMQTVEPVFGQIKQGRGFRQFLLRGLEKVNGEWSLICTGHKPESSSGAGSAQTVPLRDQSAQESTSRWARPTHQELCRGSQHCDAYEAIDPSQAATANYSRRYLTAPVPQGRLGNPQTGC